MPQRELNKFFLSIVFPSILAISLFIVSIFVIILPTFERNMMNGKKEMISELTHTAWSLLDEYHYEYQYGTFTLEEAQELASRKIERIRYGADNKDYFWLITKEPKMVMHPYRFELIDSNLTNYKDANGKPLFVESVAIANEKGEGFVDYMWQWKDDSTRIVPKLSYVKGFEPWNWIVGTGIYLEDVKTEIRQLKNRLLRVSLLITLVIAVILSFVIRQSLFIENRRSEAAEKLRLSRQKYKSLVEASTEGTLMIINNDIIFCNLKFSKLIGYDPTQVTFMKFEDLFTVKWKKVIPCFDDPKKSVSIETKLRCSDGSEKEVIISISKIKLGESHGYIIITKEISAQKQLVKETEHLASELQTSLLLMNQPIKHFTQEMLTCDFETTIQDAATLMTRKKQQVVFVQKHGKIIGVINANDLKDRVVAVGLDIQSTIIEIMTSPVVSISENALLYEAILLLKSKAISHLAINNETGTHIGVLGFNEISKMQQNSVSYLIKEVEISESVDELKAIYKRVPVLVSALIESGDKTQNITRIITSISDAIVKRLIQLGIEQQGEPPCEFAFMVMGSEGRMEQTLLTDQDNAIIFSDLTDDDLDLAYKYFQKLGAYVCGNLHKVGYKLCDGDNMAQNPKWTQPVSKWKEYFTQWINTSEPQDILDASIFFDFREVFGSEQMIEDLRQHVNTSVESKSIFLYHMAQSVLKFKPPVSVFGNIVSSGSSNDQNTVNVKKLLMPIIGFIRVYSLSNAINETNSLSRLKQLYVKEIVKKSMYDELVLAYNYLMQMRFRFQTENILQDLPPNNDININKLTHIEIATLKKIFSEIGNIQTQINFDFKIINT